MVPVIPKNLLINVYESEIQSRIVIDQFSKIVLKIFLFNGQIKSVPWEYSCVKEFLEEFNYEVFFKYSLLLSAPPQNKLNPNGLGFIRSLMMIFLTTYTHHSR